MGRGDRCYMNNLIWKIKFLWYKYILRHKYTIGIDLDKSLATEEKRYVPKVGGKRLLLSWDTRTMAEIYARAIAARYQKLTIAHQEN